MSSETRLQKHVISNLCLLGCQQNHVSKNHLLSVITNTLSETCHQKRFIKTLHQKSELRIQKHVIRNPSSERCHQKIDYK
ncbi:hypothetical protein Tco_1374182, partial [Tanacetum coccineum]